MIRYTTLLRAILWILYLPTTISFQFIGDSEVFIIIVSYYLFKNKYTQVPKQQVLNYILTGLSILNGVAIAGKS